MKDQTKDILRRAEDNLDTARMGIEIYRKQEGRRRLAGIRNVAVFGRSVTFVLQKLKSVEEEFDGWYQEYLDEMKGDPLMEYFKTLRNEVEKEGKLSPTPVVEIEHLSLNKLKKDFPPPPGATQLIIGDAQDGNSCYWLVEEDGEERKFYIDPPNVETKYHFPDPPERHLGNRIEDPSVASLAEKYLDYLERMLADARQTFGG